MPLRSRRSLAPLACPRPIALPPSYPVVAATHPSGLGAGASWSDMVAGLGGCARVLRALAGGADKCCNERVCLPTKSDDGCVGGDPSPTMRRHAAAFVSSRPLRATRSASSPSSTRARPARSFPPPISLIPPPAPPLVVAPCDNRPPTSTSHASGSSSSSTARGHQHYSVLYTLLLHYTSLSRRKHITLS